MISLSEESAAAWTLNNPYNGRTLLKKKHQKYWHLTASVYCPYLMRSKRFCMDCACGSGPSIIFFLAKSMVMRFPVGMWQES